MKENIRKFNQYIFGNTDIQNSQPVVLVTGVARSGTSLLGKLVASLEGVEFEYEPSILAHLPILQAEGALDSGLAVEMLRHCTSEMFHTHLLGRGVNVRPTDDSCIWNYKTRDELDFKWDSLRTRQDAWEYAKKRKSVMAMKMVNLQPFYGFLQRVFPAVKIIHIVRNGYDTALSIEKKGWFTDEALLGDSLSMKRRVSAAGSKKEAVVPWWVEPKEAETFLAYSNYTRAFYCWRVLLEKGFAALNGLEALGNDFYMEVRYESLLKNPRAETEKISRFIGSPFGFFTESLIATVDRGKPVRSVSDFTDRLDLAELEKAKPLLGRLSYDAGN